MGPDCVNADSGIRLCCHAIKLKQQAQSNRVIYNARNNGGVFYRQHSLFGYQIQSCHRHVYYTDSRRRIRLNRLQDDQLYYRLCQGHRISGRQEERMK